MRAPPARPHIKRSAVSSQPAREQVAPTAWAGSGEAEGGAEVDQAAVKRSQNMHGQKVHQGTKGGGVLRSMEWTPLRHATISQNHPKPKTIPESGGPTNERFWEPSCKFLVSGGLKTHHDA